MSSKKKTSAELQADAEKLAERLKEVRAEARKARRVEKLKEEKEKLEQDMKEAYELIKIAKTRKITVGDESISVYEYLQRFSQGKQ